LDMVAFGKEIRYSERFATAGINVNVIQKIDTPKEDIQLRIRTYERGVEDETLACGTGVTAAALAVARANGLQGRHEISVSARGGDMRVRFWAHEDGSFSEVWLCGPAAAVFEGVV
jgi:diaminopimelate epimerase